MDMSHTAPWPQTNSVRSQIMVTSKYTSLLFTVLLLYGCGQYSSDPLPLRGGLIGVWEPEQQPIGVFILHQGHTRFDSPGPADLVPVARRFRDAGYIVYGFEMPEHSANNAEGLPIETFFAPVLQLIDALPGDLPIYMAGLSGGGWTTTVVTSMSERIVKGYSVAGDAPLDIPQVGRDWEQLQFDYRQLYSIAGSRLIHIYIKDDPCCWSNIVGDVGYFYVTDFTNPGHAISEWSMNFILSDVQ